MSLAPGESFFSSMTESARAGVVFVFQCYLDDSNNTSGPTLGIGGYVARADAWQAFERVADPFLNSWGVKTLRGKDFNNGHGDFKTWSGPKKAQFVDGLYRIAGKHVILGTSTTVEKQPYERVRRATPDLRNVSPLALAFASTVQSILYKDGDKFAIWPGEQKVSFVVELGNKNNENIVRYYAWLRDMLKDDALGQLSFVNKQDCRAIQLAAFLAFHGRREGDRWSKNGYSDDQSEGAAMKIMLRHAFHRHNRLQMNKAVRYLTAEDANAIHTEADFDKLTGGQAMTMLPPRGLR